MRRTLTPILAIMILMIAGCENDEAQLRAWQQQQVEYLGKQSEQNAAAAKALVEADANARRELALLERDLQAERAEIGRQRDTLEAERRSLALERQRTPMIAAAVQGLGTMALAALPLMLCWLLLRNAGGGTGSEELENLLILNLTSKQSPLLLEYRPEVNPSTSVTDAE